MSERTDTSDRQPLSFESDRGSSRSRWIAGALVLGLAGWMGSGLILPSAESEETVPVNQAPRQIAVAVRASTAEPVTRYFTAEGQAQPERTSVIVSETAGEIAEVNARKGDAVEGGEVIARIGTAEREADLERAEEELSRAERDFNNAETLLERGSATVDRLAETRTALAAARAQLAAAEEAIDATVIRAPFAGTLEALGVEVGEYVAQGAEVGEVVDAAPLTVAIQVPQQSLSDLEVGQKAEVRFITGQRAMGDVVFVGSSAAAETRTFLAEVEVANDDLAIPAGVSAEVKIPVGESVAHFLSPAILSLGTDGALGIKTVDGSDEVVFHPVEIVRAQTDGVWVSGLPEAARIITIGQGFVSDGETVAPREEDEVEIDDSAGEAPTVAEAGQ